MIEIFDTHTHLNVDNFAGKEQEEIDFAAELGVIKMNIVGFDKPTIDKSLALSEKYDQLYSTIGWHPTEAGSYSQEIEDMIVSQLDNPKVVALGEIGLDFYEKSFYYDRTNSHYSCHRCFSCDRYPKDQRYKR